MSDLTSSLETVRSTIVTNLTSKGVSCSTTENLNDLIAKTNTVKTPVTTTLTLQDTYPNTLEGLMTCLRDKFRINLSKQGVETLSTDGLTTLSNSITLIKFDTVLTLISNKTSASTGETVTLTATLVDINGNAVNGATVVFMEGNTTLYSGLTNTLGVITYGYSSSTGSTKNLKCTFDGNTNYNSSNSSTISIIVTSYLLNDTATSNLLSTNYESMYNINSVGSGSVSYDGTNKYYVTNNTGSSSTYLPIKVCNDLNNFKINMDIYVIQYQNAGLYFTNTTNQKTGDTIEINWQLGLLKSGFTNGSWNGDNGVYGGCSYGSWYNLEASVQGSSVTYKLYNSTGTQLYTNSFTLKSSAGSGFKCGVRSGSSAGTSAYFKNIKVVQV